MNRHADTSQTWIGRSSTSSRFPILFMFDPVQRLRHNCSALVLALKQCWNTFTLSVSTASKACCWNVSTACFCCCWNTGIQQHAFVAVKTLVYCNDSQVSSQIYRIALAHGESKEREKKEKKKRKKIVKIVVKIVWYWSVFCVFWCTVRNEVTSVFSRIEDSCNVVSYI